MVKCGRQAERVSKVVENRSHVHPGLEATRRDGIWSLDFDEFYCGTTTNVFGISVTGRAHPPALRTQTDGLNCAASLSGCGGAVGKAVFY